MGIIPAFMEAEGLTPEVKAAVQRAAQELQNQGAELVEVDLRTWTPPSPPTTSSARPRRFPTWHVSRRHSLRLSGGGLRQPVRPEFAPAPTALAPRPSAVRCSAPTC